MTTTTATPVRFTQLPDHSLALGLSATRAITLAFCVLAVAIVMVASGMTAGLVTTIGVSPVAGSALLMVEGRALIEWTPDAVRYLWRGANGRLCVLANPDRPTPAGVLPIPGTAQQLAVFAAADGSAILHDAAADTWTTIASVNGTGFLYADAEIQDAATAGFGRALAAIGSDGQIQRIHIIHRTRHDTHQAAGRSALPGPMGGKRARDRAPDRVPARKIAASKSESDTAAAAFGANPDDGAKAHLADQAVSVYQETLDRYCEAWRHDTLIAMTLGGKAARAAIRRAGHGRPAAARVLASHQASLAGTLDAAGAILEKWFTPADLADWITDGFDPTSIPITELRPVESGSADHANTAKAGPMAVAETWSTVRTDSAFHQVLWISQWPRFETHPAFLASVTQPADATVTVSLIYEPIPTPVALRQIGRDKTAQASDAALRRRLGTLDTAEQAARESDTLRRETEIAEGHLDTRHTALVTVTSVTRDELTDAATRIRQVAAAAGCETRILYGQQLAALNATILPASIRL
jgi:hypothetical protein